jgi:NAD(P)-dependent dehydrogenase (short-subunit alcohol dehydrogenase family)
MKDLNGKAVLLTGAATGIGYALAKQFARLILLENRAALDGLRPDVKALARSSSQVGCNGYYPFTLASPAPGFLSHGRMFAAAIGIPEDAGLFMSQQMFRRALRSLSIACERGQRNRSAIRPTSAVTGLTVANRR